MNNKFSHTKGVNVLNKKHIMTIATVLIILLGSFITFTPNSKVNFNRLAGIPTIFIHGYKGTYNSFANMLKRLEEDNGWGEKVLLYRVTKEGKIHVFQTGRKGANPAYIQVVLEDNRASFEDSAKWLSHVLAHLKENYNVPRVNLVGHSMGGIIALKYIMEYQDKERFPQTSKLITIGSPFDGIYSEEYFRIHRDAAAIDLMPDSAALNIFRTNKKAFPSHIEVLSIGSTGDFIAVPESVESIQDIVSANHLQQIMIEDDSLGHSALHENKKIDKLVHDYLYGE